MNVNIDSSVNSTDSVPEHIYNRAIIVANNMLSKTNISDPILAERFVENRIDMLLRIWSMDNVWKK